MKRHGMHGAALAASLFVLGACGGGGSPGAGGGDDGGGSGPIESPALRFSWDEPGMSRGAGGGAVDLPGSATEVVLQAEGSGRRSLGLQAVDGLVAPRLDGVPLMDAMLTESVLTFGDGPAHYTYWDRFDPQWRGRVPQWIAYTEELGRPIYGDPLDGVTPDDPRRPKVLRDAILDGVGDLFFQRDIEGRIRLLWSGALRYCFAAGRPIRALQLQGPDEDRGTVLDAAPGTRIRVSADGAEWSTLWTAAGEGEQRPRVTLPSALVGSPTLCLAFETPSGEAQGFQRLYVRLELEGDDLAALAQFPGGERRIRFEDAPDSSHHARLAWTDPTLTLRVQPPQAGPAPLRVALGDAVLALARSDEGVPGAPARLEVGDLVLWQAAPGQGWGPPARFRVVQGRSHPSPATGLPTGTPTWPMGVGSGCGNGPRRCWSPRACASRGRGARARPRCCAGASRMRPATPGAWTGWCARPGSPSRARRSRASGCGSGPRARHWRRPPTCNWSCPWRCVPGTGR